MFLLLTCWIVAGVMADDLSAVYYRLRHSSVCLYIKSSPQDFSRPIEASWNLGGKLIKSNTKSNPAYEKKVDYDMRNHTLCVKNLMDGDSGTYEFTFNNATFYKKTEKHIIVVQGAVPSPVLSISVLDSNTSSGFCNVSVNCSFHSEWLWSFCESDSCTTSQESVSSIDINVYTDNRTVVCTGSNRVSRNNASQSLTAECSRVYAVVPHKNSPLLIVIALVFFLCLIALLLFLTKKLAQVKHDEASNIHLIKNQREPQTQPEPRTSSSSSSQAYENVVAAPSPSRGSGEEPEPAQSHKVDTVYCVLQPTKANLSQGRADGSSKPTTVAPRAQEASQSVSHVDTVYSQVEKPKQLKQPRAQQTEE